MNPRYHLPGAYVQYAKFAGPDLTSEIVDQAELSGDLQTILRELETRLRAVNQTHISRVSGFRETMTHDFPEIALQQIVYNAVMHRDYQSNTPIRVYCYPDRIDVHSPGGLFGEVTRDTLERRSSYRNPVIAEFMKTLGYVNRFGMGIRLAQSHMQRNGNPPVTFECDDRTFLATLSRRPS
jgi:ATP-dependent DNA helicase RecG